MRPTADDYQREHAKWMDARAIGIDDQQEAAWAEKLHALYEQLEPAAREAAKAWVAEQTAYREAHGLTFEDLTPSERRYVEYSGEYELILGEDDTDVLFQINGQPMKISRGILLDYDQEGRFWCSMEHAKKLGLAN